MFKIISKVLSAVRSLFSKRKVTKEPPWGLFNPPFDSGCIDIRGFGTDVMYTAEGYTEVYSCMTFTGKESVGYSPLYLVVGDSVCFASDRRPPLISTIFQ